MNKQKITIYYSGFLRFGGVLTHLHSIERELVKMGWCVTVITLDRLPIFLRYFPHVIQYVVNFFSLPLGFYYKDRVTSLLYKIFFNNQADIRLFEDIYVSWNSKTPSVTILHAVWSDNLQSYSVAEGRRLKLINREIKLINRIDHALITVSDPYANFLLNSHFSNKLLREIDVVPLGVDLSFFAKSKIAKPRNNKSIVYTGTLEKRKNVSFLIEVYRRLKEVDDSYQLTLIGDGPERANLQEFSSKNGLNVIFLGALNRDSVICELFRHGIYLHSSTKESFSYSLLEAKLSGLITCAHFGLQVPDQFVDIPMMSFDADEWCQSILKIDGISKPLNGDIFSIQHMTAATLEKAK